MKASRFFPAVACCLVFASCGDKASENIGARSAGPAWAKLGAVGWQRRWRTGKRLEAT